MSSGKKQPTRAERELLAFGKLQGLLEAGVGTDAVQQAALAVLMSRAQVTFVEFDMAELLDSFEGSNGFAVSVNGMRVRIQKYSFAEAAVGEQVQ